MHFLSVDRLNTIFCIKDLTFFDHVDEERDLIFHLTSSGYLQTSTGGNYKCWGWSETQSTVIFVYTDAPNAESATELAKFTTVTRPNFVTDHVEIITDNRRVKNKTIRHYVLDVKYNEDTI